MRKMSISDVLHRRSNIITEGKIRVTDVYPLYSNYKENYNFKNIKESMDKWRYYSPIIEKCTDKLLELYELVTEKGSIKEIEEATKITTRNLSTLKENINAISQLKLLNNTDVIIEELNCISECDNILNTHTDISNRFNIDKYIQETSNDLDDCIYGLCEFIDTYDVGLNTKYRICLNEAYYSMYKNGVKCPLDKIIESVTDYFLFNHMNENDWNREILYIMEDVINENPFIHDTSYIKYLQEISLKDNMINEDTLDKEEWISDIEFGYNRTHLLNESISDKAKDLISKFKTLPSKSISAFKSLINELLNVKEEQDVIDGTGNVLALAFLFFVTCGAFAISLWAGIVVFITSTIISTHLSEKSTDKVLKVWYRNKIKAQNKLNKTKDPEQKKKIEEYISGLDKGIIKLESYKDSLKTDDEPTAAEARPEKLKSKDDDLFTDFKLESVDEEILNELSIKNTMQLAKDTVEKKVHDLDIKQKEVSQKFDIFASKVKNTVHNMFAINSREAVVKGDFLPSFSKCFKLAIGIGGLTVIHPFLGLAAMVTGLMCRKDAMRQERQKFINELDVELTMIDKYIHDAEDKKDYKKLRELLLIKKKLQGHYGRLKYNMKINYNDHDGSDIHGYVAGSRD